MPRPKSPAVAKLAEPLPAYHHGDLRRALVEAAVTLLAEQNHWDFSLREVARRAGVSHNAPYNHFADKRALLSAMAAAGFDSLCTRLKRAETRTHSPADALVTVGAAYVHFGVAHPAQYRLMFGFVLGHEEKEAAPELAQAAAAAKLVLGEIVRRGAQERMFAIAPDDSAALDLAVLSAWSLVHGLTMLTIDGLVGDAAGHGKVQALAERVTHTFLDGLRRR